MIAVEMFKLADKVSKVMMVMLFCMSRQDRERERSVIQLNFTSLGVDLTEAHQYVSMCLCS